MYKVINSISGTEINILSPTWRGQIPALRQMAQVDSLACQGCGQPVRVKAGRIKRPHFAHKHLQACTLGTESPEMLEARAVLYEWLESQFGDAVVVEKKLDQVSIPRPLDCWVNVDGKVFGYWIIASGIKFGPREEIKRAFVQSGFPIHLIFLQSMLHEERREFHSVLLSPTERAFLQTTPYDQIEAGRHEAGFTLHYLDTDHQMLTTYRNLSLFHKPNWFIGIKKTNSLSEVWASRMDGTVNHPGEMGRLRKMRQKQRQFEKNMLDFQERENNWGIHLANKAKGWQTAKGDMPSNNHEDQAEEVPIALPCVTCGQITTDYWSTFFDETGRQLCRCRECLNGLV